MFCYHYNSANLLLKKDNNIKNSVCRNSKKKIARMWIKRKKDKFPIYTYTAAWPALKLLFFVLALEPEVVPDLKEIF